MPVVTVLAILAIAVALGAFAMWAEDVTMFGPGKTHALAESAEAFCLEHCKTPNGKCPLSLSEREQCPLFQFVEADMATTMSADHMAHLKAVA